MKKIFLLLAIIFICSSSAFAQYEIDDVYYKPQTSKKANKITIEITNMTNTEAFDYVIKTMLQDGYFFDNIDEKYMFATTKSKDFTLPDVGVIINIFVDNHHILFTGKLKTNITDWSTIQKTGMKGSPARIAWNELERVAGLFQ